MTDCLGRLLEIKPKFKVPPQHVGIGPESDDEWNEWVHEMIRQFLSIRAAFDFARLAVISFIDS